MTTQLTIEDTKKMIKFGTELVVSNNDVDQFITKMIKEFFPDAEFDIIKQIFEWAKYPDLKLIQVRDIIQIEKDFITKEMKKKLNGTICSQAEYQAYQQNMHELNSEVIVSNVDYNWHDPSRNIRGNRVDLFISFDDINRLIWDIDYSKLYTVRNNQHGNYVQELPFVSKYLSRACIFISIWETKQKEQLQLLLSNNSEIVQQKEQLQSLLSSNTKMSKQIETLNDQLDYLQSQVYAGNNKISLLQSTLNEMKSKFMPETIEYNYEEIKARLDPIRQELKMAQRLFARVIRNQYQAPMAVLVGTKSCE